jgi:hypothetical protein
MNRDEATDLITRAIYKVVERESALLDLDVTERALAHHLARYIGEGVASPLSVDCEYNRHFQNPKRLNLPPRQALDRELRATTVFPDIVIHERNTDARNYVVLELKKPGEPLDYDERKLRAFQHELGYRHAAHVVLGRAADGVLVRDLRWLDSPS